MVSLSYLEKERHEKRTSFENEKQVQVMQTLY